MAVHSGFKIRFNSADSSPIPHSWVVCVCDKGIEGGGEELFCTQHCSGKEESNKILLEYSALLS